MYLFDIWKLGRRIRCESVAGYTPVYECVLSPTGARHLRKCCDVPYVETDSFVGLSAAWEVVEEPKSLGQLNYEAAIPDKPGDLGHLAWKDLQRESQDAWEAAADVVIEAARERGKL